MKFKKSEIKTGCWIQLENMPWFPAAYYRGEDKRTVGYMRTQSLENYKKEIKLPAHKRNLTAAQLKKRIKGCSKIGWYKVIGTRNGLVFAQRINGYTWKNKFYMKWVTNVAKSKSETREV